MFSSILGTNILDGSTPNAPDILPIKLSTELPNFLLASVIASNPPTANPTKAASGLVANAIVRYPIAFPKYTTPCAIILTISSDFKAAEKPSISFTTAFIINKPPSAETNILTAVLLLVNICINTASTRVNILINGIIALNVFINSSMKARPTGASALYIAAMFCISICILAANNCIL